MFHEEDLDHPLALPASGRLGRLGAALLDKALWFGIAGGLAALFSLGGLSGMISGGILATAIIGGANVMQDLPFGGGTSLGRRATSQVLVDERGFECTHGRGAARNALRLVSWVLGCGIPLLVDLGLVLIHPKGLTLADIAMKTQVVDCHHARPRPDQLAAQQRRLIEG